MVVLLVVLAWPALAPYLARLRREALEPGPLFGILRLGLPIGAQTAAEFVMFAVISILAGLFGTETLDGHQIAINLISLSFMVPAGIGGAACVLVGNAIGAGDPGRARRMALAALIVGEGYMLMTALVFSTMPGPLAHLYSNAPSVVAIATTLLPIAGVFQVFDGAQVVSSGTLRGAGDTLVPMWANVFGYGVLGLPVSLWLGFHEHQGIVGLWWGFVVGLGAVGILLVTRSFRLLGGPLDRVRVGTSHH
jgi:MATE family multidrug resistance protein